MTRDRSQKSGANRMLPRNHFDRIQLAFADHRLVDNAGLLLSASLARHLGLRLLVDHHLNLGSAPGQDNTDDKLMALVASALSGGDCIDDADAMRAGGKPGVFVCVVRCHPPWAPSSAASGGATSASWTR